MNSTINTSRIAYNTMLLYVRMIFITLIALFTSRVLLNTLGVEDYGIYNVVAGVVVLFSFLNTAMTSATQRFITFSLGKDDSSRTNMVFITSFTLHVIIAFVLIVFSESVGLAIFNGFISIPEGREDAAKIVYQFAILTMVFHVMAVPYISAIIAHEKLGYYAFISIIDAILKLTVAYATKLSSGDNLALYSVLLCIAAFFTLALYYLICKMNFTICRLRWMFDKTLFKKMLSFSGWSLFGQFSVVSADQGSNILLNRFFTVALNSTMGVTNQVNNAVNNLVTSFQTAFQPQITKAYANSEYKEMNSLMQKASRISYFLLLIVCIPMIANINQILIIWLKIVPDYCAIFCSLLLMATLINSISGPLWMSIFASGNIKRYQVLLSIVYLLQIPAILICFAVGLPPYYAIIIKVVAACVILIVRLYFNKINVSGFELRTYIRTVLVPLFLSTIVIISCISPIRFLFYKTEGLFFWILTEGLSFLISVLIVFHFGFTNSEREIMRNIINKRLNKWHL